MAMKGIMITSENQQELLLRYGEIDADIFPVGYIMVTDFGDNGEVRYQGVLNQAGFDAAYEKGVALLNGFFAVIPK